MATNADETRHDEEEALDQVEEQLEQALVIQPPDGGYGWFVVAGSFLCNLLVDGIIFTAGAALQAKWKAEFGASETSVSLVSSLLAATYLLAGPLAGALGNWLGCRNVVMIGAFVAFLGFVCSTIASGVFFLYISFGLVAGVGLGLIYLNAVVVVSQYFTTKRAGATGLAVCGSGIGTSIFAAVNPMVMRYVGDAWRPFVIFCGLATLLNILPALLFRPLHASQDQIDKVARIAQNFEEDEEARRRERTASRDGDQLEGGPQRSASGNKTSTSSSAADAARRPFLSTLQLNAEKGDPRAVWSQTNIAAAVARESVGELNRPLSRADIFYPGSTTSLAQREGNALRRRTGTAEKTERTELVASQTPHRQQSFCAASKSNINLSYVGLPAAGEPRSSRAPRWIRGVLEALSSLVDPELLRSPSFLLLAVSGCLSLSCFFVPFLFLAQQLARLPGETWTESQLALPIVLLGINNIVGRIACGLISDLPSVDALLVSWLGLIIAGVATMLVPLLNAYWMFLVYTGPFAIGLAVFAALRTVVCVELYGVDKLSNAYGILLLAMGVGALVGSPLAGFLKDLTGNFDASFYIMGALMALSGVLLIPLRALRRREISKDAAKEDHEGEQYA